MLSVYVLRNRSEGDLGRKERMFQQLSLHMQLFVQEPAVARLQGEDAGSIREERMKASEDRKESNRKRKEVKSPTLSFSRDLFKLLGSGS
jgi:hypothetical protein